MKINIQYVGDSAFVPLPPEVLAKMGIQVGDWLLMTETATGFLLTPVRKKKPSHNKRRVSKR